MTDYCECGYFKGECECCGEGKICPVCKLPKNVYKEEEET